MKIKSRQILILAGLLILLTIPLFITTPYYIQIFIVTFYIGSASLGWSVLGGLTGQTSLGHAAFMGLGAYTSAILYTQFAISPWIAIIVSFLLVGTLSSILLFPCFILKGPYFTLVTIAFAEAFRNLFINWDFVGKGQGIRIPYEATESFWDMRFATKGPYYFIALGMFLSFLVIIKLIDRSRLGYALKTVREDEDTANAIGINPRKYKIIATFISTGLAAVAGVFYSMYYRFIDPDIMLQTYSVEFVLPAVIGGIGITGSAAFGALLIVPLSEILRGQLSGILPGANILVYALILILIIRFSPKGILGWFTRSKLKKKIDGFFDGIDAKFFKGGDIE